MAARLAACLALLASPSLAVVVDTAYGQVLGAPSTSMPSIVNFLGVPFAAPPVGALRWSPPSPPAPWTGVKNTTTPADHCIQPPDVMNPGPTSEDCLYLNGAVGNGSGV